MSQTTRCPHCATTFRVVADQLRIGGGWVRCGHCKQVFDATEHLQIRVPAPTPAAESPPGLAPSSPPPVPPPFLLAEHQPAGQPAPAPGLRPEPEPESEPEPEPEPEPLPEPVPEPELEPEPKPVPEPEPEPEPEAEPEPEPEPQAPLAEPLQTAALPPPSGPESRPAPMAEPEPSFVRAARRNAFWRHPAMRGLLTLLALALAALLMLQMALQQRDALAARYPAARAVLEPLCQQWGCTLQAPRELAAVVIDSSSFVATDAAAGRYELRFALKNSAGHAVAMPLVELTLTDARDDVVLRRVLDPQRELGAAPALAARSDWGVRTPVELAGVPTVAGYRVLAFYP